MLKTLSQKTISVSINIETCPNWYLPVWTHNHFSLFFEVKPQNFVLLTPVHEQLKIEKLFWQKIFYNCFAIFCNFFGG